MSIATTPTAESAQPDRDELVRRAAELVPLLQEDAAQADRDRVLTQRVVDATTDAGMFKLMVPRRLGGYETDATTMLEVIGQLGRGCAAAAWVAGVYNFTAWEVGLFSEQAQRDVWDSDPAARCCFSLSPAAKAEEVDGGIVLNGQWPNASGSAHCEWAALGVSMRFGPAGPEFTKALVPMSELTVEDTWYMAGVRGSASRTVIAENVFVPAHRLLPLGPAVLEGKTLNGHPEETLYHTSFAAIANLSILASQLGLGERAIELVVERSKGRPIAGTNVRDQSESVAFQMQLAETRTKLDVAWLLSRRTAADADAAARTGALPSDEVRGRIRMDTAYASQQVTEAIELLMDDAGSSAFADSADLQRIWRDVSTATRHIAFKRAPAREVYGRVLLGHEPGVAFPF